jgi:hypothetical protein
MRWRVVAIESLQRGDASLRAPIPRAPGPYRGDVRGSEPVSRTQAAQLAWEPLWPGAALAGLPVTAIELQELSRGFAPNVRAGRTRGEGVRLLYGGGARLVEVLQAPAAEPAYGFGSGRLTFGGNPVPAEGLAELAQVGSTWLGQLRRDGVYVSIWGPTRELVLDAARALRPIGGGA